MSVQYCENVTVKQCSHEGKKKSLVTRGQVMPFFLLYSDECGIAYKVFLCVHVGPHSCAAIHAEDLLQPLCMLSKHFTPKIHPKSHNYSLVNLDSGICSQIYVSQQLRRMDKVSCKGLGRCPEVTSMRTSVRRLGTHINAR